MSWFVGIQIFLDLVFLVSICASSTEPPRRSLVLDEMNLLERVARIEKRLGLKDLPR